MAGSNGIPADAGRTAPEEKCLGSESHQTQGAGRRRYHGEPTFPSFLGALTHNFWGVCIKPSFFMGLKSPRVAW